jgi:hypothetical protein
LAVARAGQVSAEIERPKIALTGTVQQVAVVQPAAIKPAPLPPAEFDRPYTGGQMIVTKWNDYNLLRLICKDDPTAIACSYRVYDSVTGKSLSCLIMLGPAAHDDKRVLRHEIGHCNGWSNKHEGARLSER